MLASVDRYIDGTGELAALRCCIRISTHGFSCREQPFLAKVKSGREVVKKQRKLIPSYTVLMQTPLNARRGTAAPQKEPE